jgi:hypothetical protein
MRRVVIAFATALAATASVAAPSFQAPKGLFAITRQVDPKSLPLAARLEGACDVAEVAIDDLKATKANAKARSDLKVLRGLVCN